MFGIKFIENNKNKCKFIYEGTVYELQKYLNIENEKKELLEIKLKDINNIIDMSYMFDECSLLSSLPDISKWNIK